MSEIDVHMRRGVDPELINGFMAMLKDCRPGRLAVEIGSYSGETLALLHDSALFERIISIDPFMDAYDATDTRSMSYPMHLVRKRFYSRIMGYGNVLHLNLSSAEACELFEDNSIDFLYIDGDHRYEGVKADIRNYLPKMRNLSIVAGHDYLPKSFQAQSPIFEGVCRAVDEMLGGPDLLYQDSSWLKYLGYRPSR